MNIKERLKAAYENVVFNADNTWINDSNEYQKANLNLFRKERQIELIKVVELRPRTVNDSIPESRLARYSNYEYNESRELSYAPCNYSSFNNFTYYSRERGNQLSKEAWLLPEVDDFFLWFTNYNIFPSQITHESLYNNVQNIAYYLSTKEMAYESPILRVDSLDSRILKMQITSDRIKNIWNVNSTHIFNEFSRDVNDKTLNVYKTPAGIFILTEDAKYKELLMEKELLRKLKSDDVKHLKYLSKSFQEQNARALKCIAHNSKQSKNHHANKQKIMECQTTSLLEQSPTRRLYSAVLQGLTTTKKPLTKIRKFTPLVAASCQKCKDDVNDKQSISWAETNSFTEAKVLEDVTVNSPDVTQSFSEQLSCDASESNIFNQRSKDFVRKLEPSESQQQKAAFENTEIFKTNTKSCSSNKQQLDITASSESAVTASSTSIFKNTSYVQSTTSTISMCNTLNNVNGGFTMNQSSCINQYNYQINSYFNNNFHGRCVYSANTFSTNMSQMMVSRGVQARQGYTPGAYQQVSPHPLMMVPQNRTSTIYPLLQQYVHQPYYCPVQTPRPQAQRWPQPGYTRSSVPQCPYISPLSNQFIPSPPSRLILPTMSEQQPYYAAEQALSKQKPSTPTVRFRQTTPSVSAQLPTDVRKAQKESGNRLAVHSTSSSETSVTDVGSERLSSLQQTRCQQTLLLPSNDTLLNDFDEMVSKTVNLVFAESSPRREVPSVTPSISEELEIQALEQYSCSNDNVYRELERQATEQYEGYSENWRSPPISRPIFGGLSSLLRPRCGLINL